MSESRLTSLLQEWHRLTLGEGEAIRSHNWTETTVCQELKANLRNEIDQISPSCEIGDDLRRLIDEVIALESSNHEWLRNQRASLQHQQAELGGVSRNLKRVRSSYGIQQMSHWHSYS
jgi:hypothetical protein